MAEAIRFERVRDGKYTDPVSGVDLVRGVDDSDGFDRIEWVVWTANVGRPLKRCDSLHQAKRTARHLISTGQHLT